MVKIYITIPYILISEMLQWYIIRALADTLIYIYFSLKFTGVVNNYQPRISGIMLGMTT